MDYILQGLYDYCDTSFYWILGLNIFLHTISLRIWFDNRAKNEALLEMTQSLQKSQLTGLIPSKIKSYLKKINTIEKGNINLTDKIESMSKGTEKLSERIHTVEFDNQNLLKSYDKLADRLSLQDGNLHAIQIMSKDEMLSLKKKLQTLESHVQNEDQRLGASMKSLEIYNGQKILALQKTVVKRFEMTEKIIEADEQGKKVQGQDLTSLVAVRDGLPLVEFPTL